MKRILLLALAATMSLSLVACIDGPGSAAQTTREAAETNQRNLLSSSPVPILQRSEERENLIKRATRLNQQNMTGCVSIFAQGQLLYQGVVDGKVSSLNSYLLPSDDLQWNSYGMATIEAADIDGAYGENADGVFFFNADSDAYIEAAGVAYIYTDQCLATTQKPILVQAVPSAN